MYAECQWYFSLIHTGGAANTSSRNLKKEQTLFSIHMLMECPVESRFHHWNTNRLLVSALLAICSAVSNSILGQTVLHQIPYSFIHSSTHQSRLITGNLTVTYLTLMSFTYACVFTPPLPWVLETFWKMSRRTKRCSFSTQMNTFCCINAADSLSCIFKIWQRGQWRSNSALSLCLMYSFRLLK